MTEYYILCDVAWKLYDAWCKLADSGAHPNTVAAAWRAFEKHKAECEKCERPENE
jgi:hypothetical protein